MRAFSDRDDSIDHSPITLEEFQRQERADKAEEKARVRDVEHKGDFAP